MESEQQIRPNCQTVQKSPFRMSPAPLSIIFGVTKFNDYLYGRKFVLYADHKPLVKIFGPKRGIPTLAAARLQRWSLILAAYQYEILYKPELQQAETNEELLQNDVTDVSVLKTRAHGIVSENASGDDSNHVVPEKPVESRVSEATGIQEGTVRPKRQVKPPVRLDL
ncbi:hypothetical protein M9458_050528 [Cirrhinus mrigala]|uniref:Reverse transcriptase RNase H-like domain-containing protein n=1 Tax=Cirrhinus mrigala TaxID=683832 RepID=A0ABD0MYT7_CIRMR